MQQIEIVQIFDMPVERLFTILSEHENLEKLFYPIKVKRLSDGQDQRNGVGSARQLQLLVAPPFVETVTQFVENELIEYKITKGSPLKNHLGIMRFEDMGGQSKLTYTIVFESKIPGAGAVIKFGLENAMRKGLRDLNHRQTV
ncbi:MAG: SRPBCC family protein [Pseudomonadota bacterium]|nr:SRPBCC family protein [Pseudomonadota bacterium]